MKKIIHVLAGYVEDVAHKEGNRVWTPRQMTLKGVPDMRKHGTLLMEESKYTPGQWNGVWAELPSPEVEAQGAKLRDELNSLKKQVEDKIHEIKSFYGNLPKS